MKTELTAGLLFCLLLLFCVPFAAKAADYPKQPITIKLEGAKLPLFSFPHAIHVEKQKLDCVTSHHKNPENPTACTTCHGKPESGKARGPGCVPHPVSGLS